MTFMGHKQVLWLQYGEIVWNMGDGTSQGTTVVVICNSFVGQRGPSRGIKGHQGSNEVKNVLFWP